MDNTPIEETPVKRRKYPQRIRSKTVKYTEFEMSMEETPRSEKVSNKVESSDEEEDEGKENSDINDTEEISEYEKMRLKNLEENRRMMIELGLIDPKKEHKAKIQSTRPKPKPPKPKDHTPVNPRKRSLRLLKKTPEGKDIPVDIFQDTPAETPLPAIEERTRIEEEVLPMNDSGESTDFLDSLKDSLSQTSTTSSVESTESLIKNCRDLEFAAIQRVTSSRVQGMCIHPMESKLLIAVGSSKGELGLWNVGGDKVADFIPHMRAINCISVSPNYYSTLFTTSFDGTVRRADMNKGYFDLVYQTDEKRNMCHLTWHSQIDDNNLLVAHGTGEVGIIDLRAKRGQRWFHCHHRSVRTTHLHPLQPNYFLTSSGIGECKIWDLRGSKKHVDECVSELTPPKAGKGLTSAFFSPDGSRVVTTANDDYLRIYDTTDLTSPKEIHKVMHDNHTGRWLSVFKTVWHPQSSDLLFVGSMLYPRRIQLYNGFGRLVRELKDEHLTTVVPVISIHPTLPIVVGGNSTGKAHVFTTPQLRNRYTKKEDAD